ncbi:hypothetical protein LX87_05167 [Larkinella arboricola]|uniref:Uncharacterized protein n=2 Tax=Larkinella arboricola TaxID=643671 RepID=A0A327WKQ0_LARAB|nr:hypothetical protein LX87_05167 [Larkinella arboricola]
MANFKLGTLLISRLSFNSKPPLILMAVEDTYPIPGFFRAVVLINFLNDDKSNSPGVVDFWPVEKFQESTWEVVLPLVEIISSKD